MKKGDKLYCIKNLNNTPFIKGLEYTILKIRKPDNLFNFCIVYFEEHSDYIISDKHIYEYFATKKVYRKLKIEKINKLYYE